jgi:uncharacterized protein DUF6285
MRDHPDGNELLATARKVLRESVLPLLPPERKHDALMIANAMAIAARQLERGDGPERQELAALAGLLGDCHVALAEDGPDLRAALVAANRELSRRLREGAGDPDGPQRTALFAHLRSIARQRVAESNPKYLET